LATATEGIRLHAGGVEQGQKNVIAHVERFYAELETTGDRPDLVDDFARWYVKRVEPHVVKG
jgi:hypothetical protein